MNNRSLNRIEAMAQPSKRKIGRSSIYNEVLANKICENRATGSALHGLSTEAIGKKINPSLPNGRVGPAEKDLRDAKQPKHKL